jgi:hypothetical protein
MSVNLEDLIKDGIFEIQLGVENPRIVGVSAGEGVIGRSTDDSRWVKVGASDTDWERIVVSNDGDYKFDLKLADVSESSPSSNTLGRMGNRASLGDTKIRFQGDKVGQSITTVVASDDTVKGYDVTTISGGGYSSWSNVSGTTKAVSIGNNVTEIGSRAFYGCSNLTSITIPDSVTEIGSDAFRYCSSLESVTIPDSVTEIGSNAFYHCESIESITIPDGVTEIGAATFIGCSNLTSIIISDSVTNIGSYAFAGCASLESITIPDSVTSIGSYAFYYCTSFTTANVYVDKSVIDENSSFINSNLQTVSVKTESVSGWGVTSGQTITGQSVGGVSNVTVIGDF